MSVWNANSPLEPLTGSGCIECPDGHTFAPDDALGALETATKNIFTIPDRNFPGPKFALSEMPMKPAQTNRIGGDDYATRYSTHFPNLHDVAMYDPTGGSSIKNRVMEAINNCGPDALASTAFEMSNLFCNPPRGATPKTGKDVAPIQSHAVPLELGPYCTQHFQNFQDVARVFRSLVDAVPGALKNIVGYQKIRDFVSGSHNLASAVAGEQRPQFNAFSFADRPTSAGSITWLANAMDYITAFAQNQNGFRVKMSARLFSYWMSEYAKEKGVTLNADFSNLNGNVGDYIFSANGPGSIEMISQSRNIRYTIEFDSTPIYTTSNQVGAAAWEWAFQPYYVTRPGDDTRNGEAAGFVQDMNPLYGSPCSSCPDGAQSLNELILVYNDESHCYENFPMNPLSGVSEVSEANSNVADIVNSMRIKWYFGTDAQVHFLDPLYKIAGQSCPSNIDNTWFAGRAWTAFRTRWLVPRACGALMVRVPNEDLINKELEDCMQTRASQEITLTNKEPSVAGRECIDTPAAPAAQTGYLQPDCDFEIIRPAEDTVIEIPVFRVGGVSGALEATYETADGTATQPTDYTAIASSTLAFAEGQTANFISVTIKGGDAVNPVDKTTTQFTVNWSGDDLGDGVCEQTVVRIIDRTDEDVAEAT